MCSLPPRKWFRAVKKKRKNNNNLFIALSSDLLELYIVKNLFIQFEPRDEKACLRGFRPGKTQTGLLSIHVIFSWAQIGRSAIFGREIGVPDGEVFRGKKYSILVSKIVICSTVGHCVKNVLFASVWLTGGKWNVSEWVFWIVTVHIKTCRHLLQALPENLLQIYLKYLNQV